MSAGPYSICVRLGSAAHLRIGVAAGPGGAMSTYLTIDVRIGDQLWVLTPTGRFGPRYRLRITARHYGAIAAGSGITPIFSIVATVLEEQPESAVTCSTATARARRPCSSTELEALWTATGPASHPSSAVTRADRRSRLPWPHRRPAPGRAAAPFHRCRHDRRLVRMRSGGHDHRRVHRARRPPRRRRTGPRRTLPRECDLDLAMRAARPVPERSRVRTRDARRSTTRRRRSSWAQTGSRSCRPRSPHLPDAPYGCRDGVCATCR